MQHEMSGRVAEYTHQPQHDFVIEMLTRMSTVHNAPMFGRGLNREGNGLGLEICAHEVAMLVRENVYFVVYRMPYAGVHDKERALAERC